MRKRMTVGMIALTLMILIFVSGLIIHKSFSLSMESERRRALSEEAAIARAVAMEIGDKNISGIFSAASGIQSRYGSDTLDVYLLYNERAMAGRTLPSAKNLNELLNTRSRATLLDGESRRLLIAHRLSAQLMLLLSTDVSPVYALRERLVSFCLILCACAALIASLLALFLSGMLIRPLSALLHAADRMRDGDFAFPLPEPKNDEVGRVILAFSAMKQAVFERETQLKSESEGRQELIDSLAHEMRTPLTAILSGARLLQTASLTSNERDRLLETVIGEAKRLTNMDETLLLITQLSHRAPEFSEFSMRAMAQEAASAFEGVEIVGEDCIYRGERELMIVLLRNLLVNAVRAGGEKPVRVRISKKCLSVEDNGCGMTQAEIKRAFEPFYKADRARTRRNGGAGLGLSLCKKIAEMHGTGIEILSEKERGTTVVYHMDTTL